MRERDFKAFQRLKADRELIDQAAASLRRDTTGFRSRERAYATAALISTISLHLADVPDAVRHDALRAARELVGLREERGRQSVRTRLT